MRATNNNIEYLESCLSTNHRIIRKKVSRIAIIMFCVPLCVHTVNTFTLITTSEFWYRRWLARRSLYELETFLQKSSSSRSNSRITQLSWASSHRKRRNARLNFPPLPLPHTQPRLNLFCPLHLGSLSFSFFFCLCSATNRPRKQQGSSIAIHRYPHEI